MYVISVKLDKLKLFVIAAFICIFAAVTCIILPESSSDVLNSNVSNSAKSIDEHVAFLNAYGYKVLQNPIQIQEIIIPEEFSDEYVKYNELQKISGFDLSKYKGYRIKKYTYKVTDYADSDDEVVANMLVYNNKVIGGDISSTSLGGFVHGFIKE